MTGTYDAARRDAAQMLTDGATPDQIREISRWYAATCRDTAQAYRDAANEAGDR